MKLRNLSRGDRQGDSISSLLFVLCMERLSHIINKVMHEEKYKGIRLSKGRLVLTHMFFADDLVFLIEANMEKIHIVKEFLDVFCTCSG